MQVKNEDPISGSCRTDDLHLAAFFWSQGIEPRLVPAGRTKVEFVFDDTAISTLLDEYVRGNARVEPLRFSAAIRELKRRARELVR